MTTFQANENAFVFMASILSFPNPEEACDLRIRGYLPFPPTFPASTSLAMTTVLFLTAKPFQESHIKTKVWGSQKIALISTHSPRTPPSFFFFRLG